MLMTRTTIHLILALAVSLVLTTTAFAREGKEKGGCTNATLYGDYGRLVTGTRILLLGGTEAFVGTALRTYDGNGHFTEVANSHGQTTGTERDLPKTGIYQVNVNCTGTATMFIPGFPPVETSFVIVDRGREIDHAVMSPAGQLATGVEKRVGIE